MRSVAMAILVTAAGMAAAQTRAPTAAEQKSFASYFQQQAPGRSAPPLQVQRAPGAREWTLSASSDSAPQHAVLPLCRVQRTRYTQADGAWHSASEEWLWVEHAPQCGAAPAHMVQLRAPLAEIDILRLLQAQGELLQRARLLMAGNTSCAPVRSRQFTLRALGRARDGLFLLVYESDIGRQASVSVRQSRAELTAWNVSCQQP